MRLVTKYKCILYFYSLLPLAIIWYSSARSGLFHTDDFQYAFSLAAVAALIIPHLAPFLPGFGWLIMSQVKSIVTVCNNLRNGDYTEFELPVETGDENEMISLMRTMNWMTRKIRIRESDLETLVEKRTAALKKTNNDLVEAQKASEEAARVKSEFLANMSHEIRTPINAIMGMAEIGLRSSPDNLMKDRLQIISDASGSLLSMVNEILDFSKMEAGKLRLETRSFRIRDLVEKVTDMFGAQAREKQIELIVDIAPDVPAELTGDSMRLRQIISNLVSNAVKFTPRGEIVIGVRCLTNLAGKVRIEISVSDTGEGISKEALDTIFDAFTQADGSTTRKFGGTGLGLAICKNLASMMGGSLSVSSKVDEGTQFELVLDLMVSIENTSRSFSIPDENTPPGCLLVEDNPRTRKVLSNYLSAFGFTFEAAAGETEARKLIRESSRPFDIAIIDTTLPEKDGLFLAEALQKERLLPETPVIIMATSQTEADKAASIKGNVITVMKPVKQSTLFDAIVESLGWPGAMSAGKSTSYYTPSSLANLKVLLVEDNPFNRKVASELLKLAQIVTDTAESGKEAIKAVRERSYDLVLMDIQLADMDGYEVTRTIRNLPGLADLPIIAITANAEDEERQKSVECGMTDYLTKPIDPEALFKTLENMFQNNKYNPSGIKHSTTRKIPADSRFTLPGINGPEAIKRFEGNRDLLLTLIKDFTAEAEQMPALIRQALAEGDIKKARLAAHSMKGAAANISAEAIYSPASKLESALKNGNTNTAPSLIQACEEKISELKTSLQTASTDKEIPSGPETVSESLQQSDILAPLRELDLLLARNSMEARQKTLALEPALKAHGLETEYTRIAESVRKYDFKSARAVLEPLLS